MKNTKAFTLIEVLISMVIAAILMLMIGSVAHIGIAEFTKVRQEGELYADLTFGLNLIRKSVREASTITVDSSGLYERLIVDGKTVIAFENKGGVVELIYDPDTGVVNDEQTVLSLPPSGSTPVLNFTHTNDKVTVVLTGEKNKIPFDMRTSILRRVS